MALVNPLNILSAVLVLDASLESWPMLDPALAERRQYRYPVHFDWRFAAKPVVHVGLVGVDASKGDNLRLRLRAEDIGSSGFTLFAETWFNTRIRSIEVSWLAIGGYRTPSLLQSERGVIFPQRGR